ncbi:hypothetical protein GX51_08243 [Blastomyces parvus]|uniref:Uncharacterized protein n=1 Tax=Blastomyces parvus TaxID=2060905 RepID=A0A2B7WFX6_9EURO|nr:hypothetical protein GX51_08243 [Blastomyces parvus]
MRDQTHLHHGSSQQTGEPQAGDGGWRRERTREATANERYRADNLGITLEDRQKRQQRRGRGFKEERSSKRGRARTGRAAAAGTN